MKPRPSARTPVVIRAAIDAFERVGVETDGLRSALEEWACPSQWTHALWKTESEIWKHERYVVRWCAKFARGRADQARRNLHGMDLSRRIAEMAGDTVWGLSEQELARGRRIWRPRLQVARAMEREFLNLLVPDEGCEIVFCIKPFATTTFTGAWPSQDLSLEAVQEAVSRVRRHDDEKVSKAMLGYDENPRLDDRAHPSRLL